MCDFYFQHFPPPPTHGRNSVIYTKVVQGTEFAAVTLKSWLYPHFGLKQRQLFFKKIIDVVNSTIAYANI